MDSVFRLAEFDLWDRKPERIWHGSHQCSNESATPFEDCIPEFFCKCENERHAGHVEMYLCNGKALP